MSRIIVPVKESEFGEWLDIRESLPEDTGLVLLCEVTANGYFPRKVLLPHQIYVKDLEGKEWTVFPLTQGHIDLTEGAR